MGFLKRFFRNVLHEEARTPCTSSFEHLTEEELETHLGVQRYGSFWLTDAVRPSYDLQVIPQQGFRRDIYRDEENHTEVPVLMASASREMLFELFMDFLEPLGGEVDVVLETSHDHENGGHQDLYREHIDMPVLKSILWEYEEMLLNDGCSGIAIIDPTLPREVQFDEHKMLIAYGKPLETFESILASRDVVQDREMKFITEAEHVHSSTERYGKLFEELKVDLGMDGSYV
ncbi:MAG: hypothetical protein ACOC7K_02800 [bacterium]